MVYYENGKFKRDITNRNGKETNTIRVTGLSVNSKFENNEELIIMSKTEFTKLETQISNYKDTIQDLENQVRELENITPEPVSNQKYYQELLTAKDEISTLKDTITNRNGLLLNTQEALNDLLDEFSTEFTTLYNAEITKAKTETLTELKGKTDKIKSTINSLIDYVRELENQQENHNKTVDKSNFITRALNKDTFKLEVDTSKINGLEKDLTEIKQYCISYEDIVKPVEIPAGRISEIKVNAKSNKFDIKELYIDTTDLDGNDDNITITPEAVNNGNDN